MITQIKSDIYCTHGDTFKLPFFSDMTFAEGDTLRLQIADQYTGNIFINKTYMLSSDGKFYAELTANDRAKLNIGDYIYRVSVVSLDGEITTRLSGNFYMEWGTQNPECGELYLYISPKALLDKIDKEAQERKAADEEHDTQIGYINDRLGIYGGVFDSFEKKIDNHTEQIGNIETALDSKADKIQIQSDPYISAGMYPFISYNNIIYRYTSSLPMEQITFDFPDGEYDEDYTSELSFNSGETPTTIIYYDSGILNWLGTDCSLQDGLSIFAPTANKHYDIVFYFNGTCFVGLVNGFEMATMSNNGE